MSDMRTEQTDNKITLSKEFDAPKELVFSMFKNSEHLAKWWGPEGWPATITKFEFQPGGTWQYYMTGPDGTKAWGLAKYEAIDEPNSIVYLDAFCDPDGNINTEMPQGKVTVTFEENDGKTTITSVGEYQSAEEAQKLVEMGMLEGVKQTWAKLERMLAEQQS